MALLTVQFLGLLGLLLTTCHCAETQANASTMLRGATKALSPPSSGTAPSNMCCTDGCGTNGWIGWSKKEDYCPTACGYCYPSSQPPISPPSPAPSNMCCTDGCGTNGWIGWSTKEDFCPMACGYCYPSSQPPISPPSPAPSNMCCTNGCGTNGWIGWSTKEDFCPWFCGDCYGNTVNPSPSPSSPHGNTTTSMPAPVWPPVWPGCSHEGSGSMKTISQSFPEYSKISLAYDIGADITVGNTSSASIAIHETVAEYLDMHVESGTLYLTFKDNSGVCNSGAKATIMVTEPLQGVYATSSGSLSVDLLSDFVESSSSGTVSIGKLNGTVVSIHSTGSGTLMVLSGRASQSVDVTTSGSGAVDLGILETPTATISSTGSGALTGMISENLIVQSSGSGSIQTTVTGTASGSCSGSGSVIIEGNATKSGNCFQNGRRLRTV